MRFPLVPLKSLRRTRLERDVCVTESDYVAIDITKFQCYKLNLQLPRTCSRSVELAFVFHTLLPYAAVRFRLCAAWEITRSFGRERRAVAAVFGIRLSINLISINRRAAQQPALVANGNYLAAIPVHGDEVIIKWPDARRSRQRQGRRRRIKFSRNLMPPIFS